MSTALLESPVVASSIPDEAPSLAESFAALTAESFAEAVISEMKFGLDSSPQVYIQSPQMQWTNVGTSLGAIEWSTGGPIDPYTMLNSFYYGSRQRYTVSGPAELAGYLRVAVERIERFGWAQGTMQDPWGRMCAFGALRSAGASDWDLEAINRAACKLLAERGEVDPLPGRAYTSVPRWNDRPGRTAEQVTSLLRATAEVLDAQGAGEVRSCPCCAPGSRYFEPMSLSG